MIMFEDSIDNDIMSGGNLSSESNDVVNITELKRLNNIRERFKFSLII